jgi:imidazolonepropionase-like amidohydrolase
MDDSSFRDSIEAGVLYSCVVPGSGNILAGRSAVIRNYAKTSTDALVARAGIKAAVGYNPMSASDWQGKRSFTRMGSMALLREKLYAVKTKLDSKKEDDKEEHLSREEEVLHDILTGRERLRVHVHKTDDIESMLRLMDELKRADPQFDMRISVEHAGDVHDGHIFGKLRERGIPVVYGPVDSFAYKVELRHEHWRNIRHLLDSGVELGLMTDHPVVLQKMLLFQLRWFVRLGMSKQAALEVVTRRNAEILGLGSLLGTLESGRWASFVCWNGDPFDMTRYPVAVYGEGERLFGAE